MKKEEGQVRSHKLIFRVNELELQKLISLQQKTTEKTISNFLRKIALREPLVIRYRNASADDFLNDMSLLKRELSAVGNNFNQAVKKLHILEKIPEFRGWLLIYDKDRATLVKLIETIHSLVLQLHEQWLQK